MKVTKTLVNKGLVYIFPPFSEVLRVRVKSRWYKKDKQHSIEEVAGALAFIIWRIAANGVLNLENENFQTDTYKQRLQVMVEFASYVVHLTDRLTIEFYSAEQRQQFLTELAMKLAKHYEDNMIDAVGAGKYQMEFVKILNSRMSDYAEFQYVDNKPGFPMRRYFGSKVTENMGEKDSKWITTQIIDIEAPDALDSLMKAMKNFYPQIMQQTQQKK